MPEILIDNRDGTVWDVSELVTDIVWKTSRIGKAGSLELAMIKDEQVTINNGDVLSFRLGGEKVFYGYVFTIDHGKDDAMKIAAYDQTRYLMSSDTYVLSNVTATDVVRRICMDIGLKVGHLAETRHRMSLVEDGKKLMDIIFSALDKTLIATEKIYVLYDDFGEITLRDAEDMTVDFIIGDDSLMFNWSHQRSIDKDTYNRIKLVRDNKETGRRDVYIAQDSANIARWGRLQYFKAVDENMNPAQINELLDTLITVKNRETRTLKIDALGDIRVRAGCYVPIQIDELDVNQFFLVNECTHRISGGEHTMQLDLRVV